VRPIPVAELAVTTRVTHLPVDEGHGQVRGRNSWFLLWLQLVEFERHDELFGAQRGWWEEGFRSNRSVHVGHFYVTQHVVLERAGTNSAGAGLGVTPVRVVVCCRS